MSRSNAIKIHVFNWLDCAGSNWLSMGMYEVQRSSKPIVNNMCCRNRLPFPVTMRTCAAISTVLSSFLCWIVTFAFLLAGPLTVGSFLFGGFSQESCSDCWDLCERDRSSSTFMLVSCWSDWCSIGNLQCLLEIVHTATRTEWVSMFEGSWFDWPSTSLL